MTSNPMNKISGLSDEELESIADSYLKMAYEDDGCGYDMVAVHLARGVKDLIAKIKILEEK